MGRKKSEKNWVLCKRCKEYVTRKSISQIYCTPCSYQVSKEKAYVPVIKKEKRLCENCNLYFDPNNKIQKFCGDTCKREYKIKEANKAWMTKVEKPKVRRDSDKVAYSFFRIKKNQGWLKRFKTVRG